MSPISPDWSNEAVFRLIQVMRKYHELTGQNTIPEPHRQKYIEQELNKDWRAIEVKWKNLMAYHKKLFKEQSQKKRAPKWIFFHSLSFLVDHSYYSENEVINTHKIKSILMALNVFLFLMMYRILMILMILIRTNRRLLRQAVLNLTTIKLQRMVVNFQLSNVVSLITT